VPGLEHCRKESRACRGTVRAVQGKKRQTTDSARYKALGNSIALSPWKWVLKRLCAQYERDATMASLFDGIGGFPLIWEQLNGKGSCLWASEIEEFPMAVTRKHF
jgi:DNA (cytosine-5)-methyltransferase 1